MFVCVAWALTSTPQGMPGTHPPIFWLWGRQREYPPILLRTFGYSRPILVALRSLSLKPISFGYKTPPIRFSQAGGQSAHKARPPNLELALTPLATFTDPRHYYTAPGPLGTPDDNLLITGTSCRSTDSDRPHRCCCHPANSSDLRRVFSVRCDKLF